MTTSLSRTELLPQVPQFGTHKFHNSELVSWFHRDSLATTLFYLERSFYPPGDLELAFARQGAPWGQGAAIPVLNDGR